MGLKEDFEKFKRENRQTERRPGERTVSAEEDFANLQAATPQAPQRSTRQPIGATIFGIGAGIAASPLGPAPAMAAAAMASGLGEVAQSGVETLIDSPNKPKDIPDFLGRVGREVALGSLAEGAGRGLVKGAQKAKLLFFTPRTVSGEAREAIKFLQQEGAELPVLPSKATESHAIDLMHNISEHSFTAGGTIQRFIGKRDQFMGDLATDMVQKIGSQVTPEQAGELLIASASKNLRLSRQPATVLYNTIKETIAPKTIKKEVSEEVPTGLFDASGRPKMRTEVREQEVLKGGLRTGFQDIKSFVKEKADVQKRLANIGSEVTGGTLLERFDKLADRPYVSDLIEFRTTLRGIKEGLQSGLTTKKDPAIGMLKTLESKVSDRIGNALKAKNPALLAMKVEADRIWKDGSSTFNNKVIRQLSRQMDMERTGAPQRVVKAVFAPQALTRMQTVKAAVSPEAWKKLARQGMEDILENSMVGKVISGEKLMKNLISNKGLGERGLVEAVGPVEAQRWISFANAASVQQAKSAAGEGSMLIQLKQPGVIVNLAEVAGATLLTGGAAADNDLITAGGALILGLPFIAGKIMTNPTAARALVEGMKTSSLKKGSTAAGVLTRLLGALVPRTVEAQPPRLPANQPTALGQTALSGQPQGLALQQ